MKATVKALIAGAAVAAATFATGASAATPWQREHFREVQVQRQIAAQDRHIDFLLRTHRITPRQAAVMHRQAHNQAHRF